MIREIFVPLLHSGTDAAALDAAMVLAKAKARLVSGNAG